MRRRVLIVSFDILRPHDPSPSYSIATLLAYMANSQPIVAGDVDVVHEEFNLWGGSIPEVREVMERIAAHDLGSVDVIAISVYVWCEPLVVKLVGALRGEGYRGKIVLGGYQITATGDDDLGGLYAGVDHFLKGYAEASLLRVVTDPSECPVVLDDRPDFTRLPSIYLSGVIPLKSGVPLDMLRWETKRGCVYRCGFCEWRNAANKRLFEFPMDRIDAELDLFEKHSIEKINVLDATFNAGKGYLDVARRMAEMDCTFSVQARFERLAGKKGEEFLEICESGNLHLEFGVQTVIDSEMETIGRFNDQRKIETGMKALNERGLPYEVSLIFGIPGQTEATFVESVNFVIRNGCTNINCFPLRIPRGSEMERTRHADAVKELPYEGNYSVDQVMESFSFSEGDWGRMCEIAGVLSGKDGPSFVLFRQSGLNWAPFDTREELELDLDGEGCRVRRPSELSFESDSGEAVVVTCMLDGRPRRASVKRKARDWLVYLHGEV